MSTTPRRERDGPSVPLDQQGANAPTAHQRAPDGIEPNGLDIPPVPSDPSEATFPGVSVTGFPEEHQMPLRFIDLRPTE